MNAEEVLKNAYAEEQERIEKQHKREFESLKDILVSMGLPGDEIYHEGHGKAGIAGIIIYRSDGGMYAYGERGSIEEVESLADIYRVMNQLEALRVHIESMPKSYSKSCYIDLPERHGKQYKFYCKYGIMPKTWAASVRNGVSLLNRLHDDIMGGENGIA